MEVCHDLYFGYWMATSRYIENFVTMLSKRRESHGDPSIYLCSLTYYINFLTSWLLLAASWIPAAVFIYMDYGTPEDDSEDDDSDEDLPPTYTFFSKGVGTMFMMISILYSLLTFTFYSIWFWVCKCCYDITQLSVSQTTLADFKVEDEDTDEGDEDNSVHDIDGDQDEAKSPIARLIGTVEMMQHQSDPWSTNMIVRVVSLVIRFVCLFQTFMKYFYMSLHKETNGFSKEQNTAILLFLMVCGLTLITMTLILAALAMGTGYVGDAYIYELISKTRKLMRTRSSTARVRIVEFIQVLKAFSGQAGLLFCGVEMSVEKGFYIVTLLSYLTTNVILAEGDPHLGTEEETTLYCSTTTNTTDPDSLYISLTY